MTEMLESYIVTMAENRSCYIPQDIHIIVNRICRTYLIVLQEELNIY